MMTMKVYKEIEEILSPIIFRYTLKKQCTDHENNCTIKIEI